MILRCMTLDDEPLAIRQMNSYIEQTPFLELCASTNNVLDGLEIYHEAKPDLLFIDINMPDLNGVDFVKSLKSPCLIIFTTAYSEYAIEGFNVNAVDYLLKPISYAHFIKAANKAKQQFEFLHQAETVLDDKQYLFVKSTYQLIRVKYSDIVYIEGMREYVRIHTSEGKSVMTLLSMKLLDERLPKEMFMRVHKSYIVNLGKIKVIENQRIVVGENLYIPIGGQYKDAFDAYISKFFL